MTISFLSTPAAFKVLDKILAGMNVGANTVWSGLSGFRRSLFDSNDAEGDGHSTHVASIAVDRLDGNNARPNNMQGVAYNSSLIIAGWDSSGLDPANAPVEEINRQLDPQWGRAFDFVTSQGARVINNSWGDNSIGVDPKQMSLAFVKNAPLTVQAIERALATSGPLAERIPSYANYCGVAAAYCIAAPGGGSAPGQDINGAASGTRDSLTNIYSINDRYVGMTGTSMAAPIVAGAVALVAEKYPWMTNRNLVTTILTTASEAHNAPSAIYGRGLLDVNRAINGPAIFEETFVANLPNKVTSVFSNSISGDHGLKKLGQGTLRLSANNTFKGSIEILEGVLYVDKDVSLGSDKSQVVIADATLRLGSGFVTAADGLWRKPIGVGADGAVIDTNGNIISYAGGLIDLTNKDGSLGTLSFIGTPMSIVTDLKLNADWNADLVIPSGVILSGSGAILGNLTMNGSYRPGNSPGTVTSVGSLQMTPYSELEIEVDGPGQADGLGNFDRLVFTSMDGKFSANGTLKVLLRGISAPANNNYSPALGQGFEFVSANGGVSNSFTTLEQPILGLLPGTQMDVVYSPNMLKLHVTPASYANIGAASVSSNVNRDGLGRILQGIRPNAGVRESDIVRKNLFDALAPQTASSLPVSMDQLAGVSYVQLLGLAQQNTLFLLGEMTSASNPNRWSRPGKTPAQQTSQENPNNESWGRIIGRYSSFGGNSTIGTTTDTLGGVVLGTQRKFGDQANLGFSMGYGNSSSQLPSNMGSGSTQNLQLMTYGSRILDDGYYVQGGVGFGGNFLSANRSLSLVNSDYKARIKTANISANLNFGQFIQKAGWHYEWHMGLNYLGMRTFGFNESGGTNAYEVSGQPTLNISVQPILGLTAGFPFQAKETEWQLLGSVNYAYELADNRAYLNTIVLNENLRIQSSDIGRSRLTLGVALNANISESAVFSLSLTNQLASNWNALSAFANLSVRF